MSEGELYRVGDVVSTKAHFTAEREGLAVASDRFLTREFGISDSATGLCIDAIGLRINEIEKVLKDGEANDIR